MNNTITTIYNLKQQAWKNGDIREFEILKKCQEDLEMKEIKETTIKHNCQAYRG